MSYGSMMAQGIIIGMADMGAKFVKVDATHIFFDVTKGSEIDDNDKLLRANELIMSVTGLKMKIKRTVANPSELISNIV